MSSPHAPTNIDIVSNNSSSSVVSSEVKRWATAARHEIAIGGHDTATPIFQPLILQALGVPRQADDPPQTSSMIPTDLAISERMSRWTFFTGHGLMNGVPLLGSLGDSQLDSADTRLMTLFTTTSAALSIATN
eukprot:g3567.t1